MIEFRGICKRFAQVEVLRQVSFSLTPGRTLGLVGENGAGKSTLMNLLGGNLAPDEGQMFLDGQLYTPGNPADAARHHIAFIHQELNLFPNLTIAENLFLTTFPTPRRLPLIRRRPLREQSSRLLREIGLNLPPDTPLERLSAGERQLIEVAKALAIDARVILFDEPTTSLSARETERLFELIRTLQKRGISIIYISHVLADVRRLCHDLVVLRDGEVVATGAISEFTTDRIISLMVGRNLTHLYPPRTAAPRPEIVLSARQLTQPGIVRNVTFDLHRGEVLGLFGLMGAGRSELARILFGLDPHREGTITLNGAALHSLVPRHRIQRGLAFLTEDRRAEGLCLDAPIADNIALVSLRQHARRPARLLDRARLEQAIQSIRQAVRLTPSARNEQPVGTLSGGNQQKVVLAKWLLARPAALILDEPTRGIDVGAKYEVYQLIDQLAADGAGVLLISSELEELTGLCDRILVMGHGEIRATFDRGHFHHEDLLRAALHDSALA